MFLTVKPKVRLVGANAGEGGKRPWALLWGYRIMPDCSSSKNGSLAVTLRHVKVSLWNEKVTVKLCLLTRSSRDLLDRVTNLPTCS